MDGENFNSPWEAISTIFAFISLFCLAIGPISFFRMACTYQKHLQEKKEDSKYKSLFEEYISTNRNALFYPAIFFIRRYSMICALTLLKFGTYSQICLQMTFTLGVATYLAKT